MRRTVLLLALALLALPTSAGARATRPASTPPTSDQAVANTPSLATAPIAGQVNADAQGEAIAPTVTYSSPFSGFPVPVASVSPFITQEYCTYNQSFYTNNPIYYLHVKGFESGCTRANLSVTIDLLQNGNFWKQVSQLNCTNSTMCVPPSEDYFNCFEMGVDYDVRVIGSHLYNTETIDYHFRGCMG